MELSKMLVCFCRVPPPEGPMDFGKDYISQHRDSILLEFIL